MIIPTLWIERHALTGTDLHGQPQLGPAQREKVAPVKLQFDAQHTTVRTDSAGSHGHAYELTANVVLLASKISLIGIDDVLTVHGYKVRVIEKHPRHRVTGELDHYEIRCVAWK